MSFDTRILVTDTLLRRLAVFHQADPERGIRFYRDLESEPTFTPYQAFPTIIAGCMDQLRAADIGRGTRVLVPFETSEAALFSFLGLIGLGALPLSVRTPTVGGAGSQEQYIAFLRELSERHGADAILDVPSVQKVSLPQRRIPVPVLGVSAANDAFVDARPDDLAFVQFSSGSTSAPKGIPITHKNLVWNMMAIGDNERRRPGDCGSLWLPLYHDMGLIGLLSTVCAGCDSHQTAPQSFLMNPLGWLRHVSDRRVSLSAIPNFAIDYLLRMLRDTSAEDLAGLELDCVRFVYLGSDPINIANLLEFSERLAPFGFRASAMKPAYGMAEAVLMVTCTGANEAYRIVPRPGGKRGISVGKPYAGFEVRIRSEDGRPCAEGELGEIQIRGGSLVSGYFESERPIYDADGFYGTGDLGFFDEGDLFISGRYGDRFKINGQSYFASEIEQVIEALPFSRPGRTAVIQTDDQRVITLLEAGPREPADGHAQRERIVRAVQQALGVKLEPENILFIQRGQLQRTSSGKLRRHAVTSVFEAGQIRIAAARSDVDIGGGSIAS
jgi:acyl-CoA synthetase (AMP-forming)/AMP-acid ligase II